MRGFYVIEIRSFARRARPQRARACQGRPGALGLFIGIFRAYVRGRGRTAPRGGGVKIFWTLESHRTPMVPPRGVGGPAPIFALAIFRPFLIEPLLRKFNMEISVKIDSGHKP